MSGLLRRFSVSILLAPYLLGGGLLVFLPALIAFGAAFTSYNGSSAPVFTGFANFQMLGREPLFPLALGNSLLFILQAVPLRVLGALGLALLYTQPRRAIGFYRAVAYLPTVVPDVAYALVWTWIFNPLYGPLNHILTALGLPAPGWLTDSRWGIPAIVFMSLFQIGEGFVILLAGLRHIPRDYYDAAHVDGANRWQAFSRITLPLLSPWLILLSVRDVVLSFQSTFTPAYIMTGGGPYYATYFAPMLIYETAFDAMRFGQGAAIMLIIFAVCLLLCLYLYFAFEGWGFDED